MTHSGTDRPDIRRLIAAYLTDLAAWRRLKYDDDLRDSRNLRAADGILAFAEFVETVPADDPRLRELERVALLGEQFTPGQQTAYALGLFHFHDAETTMDGFLTYITDLAQRDAGEAGRFGGTQVPGDEPW